MIRLTTEQIEQALSPEFPLEDTTSREIHVLAAKQTRAAGMAVLFNGREESGPALLLYPGPDCIGVRYTLKKPVVMRPPTLEEAMDMVGCVLSTGNYEPDRLMCRVEGGEVSQFTPEQVDNVANSIETPSTTAAMLREFSACLKRGMHADSVDSHVHWVDGDLYALLPEDKVPRW
jgi:hypothetical protein